MSMKLSSVRTYVVVHGLLLTSVLKLIEEAELMLTRRYVLLGSHKLNPKERVLFVRRSGKHHFCFVVSTGSCCALYLSFFGKINAY